MEFLELDNPTGPARYPDVYFTPGYGAAAAAADAAVWRLAYAPEGMLVPYLVRSVDDEVHDAASPYGYSGIHLAADRPPDELARCWSQAVERWRDEGLVSLFLRFSPMDPASVAAVRALRLVPMVRRPDTLTVAVDRTPDEIWNGMAGRARTAIRKARRVGLEAAVRTVQSTDLDVGSPFRHLYEQTMKRVGSAPSYFFPDRYYRLLHDGLGRSLLTCEVRDPHGSVVAASLLMRHADLLHYHLAGSDPAAGRDGANSLLLWTVLSWAAEHGCARVHLGGGVRADDGLFRFKCSFGGTRTEFWTGALVLDRKRYDDLVARHAARLRLSTGDLLRTGFFPAYRQELPPGPGAAGADDRRRQPA
ncbi:GNAT family N-acetyltransferase [Micromonospora eburnea]|uniref:Acetyltransferase (GNAT) domain-containing protein n=1 Tax=Micromonospora eburnea TaxID=227316 RepID=A0A1C6U429_9ACTN|nr:GNAT family N-acetyltransferase [Micromonospora eburnea]SCL48806.1 Acetyltransferase (GNAT) domain-containing protein [Micromonospora eburnea]